MPRTCTQADNTRECACTYEPCERKGLCCLCIAHHRAHGELPACVFPPQAELTYDRSREAYLRAWREP